MSNRVVDRGGRVPWGDALLSGIAAVSWALIGMTGVAALGLHLLGADAVGSLGPMTAAVVALGAGGSVTPTGDVSVFGLDGAEATTAVTLTPLGVGLVGALLLAWFFLRSLRGAGAVLAPAELFARAGVVLALFTAMLGGLAWAGHSVVTLDGSDTGLEDMPAGDRLGDLDIPGLGDLGGLLPDRLGDLADAEAQVGFSVDAAPTVLGGLGWCAGVLLIALLASRRTPLPPGWDAVHRVVRPAVSALVTVLLVAVLAGLAAAAYAAIGDDNPRRIAGAALLGAPNGVWLGIPVGLLVPWDGSASGELAKVLPHPLDDLLRVGREEPMTLSRLAELDGRVWLLGVAAALMMLLAGVLTAVRTPFAGAGDDRTGGKPSGADGRGTGPLPFAGVCALRLGVATAVALPLLVLLTDVSVDASLTMFGFDAFGAGIELHGSLGAAVLLGTLWGAVAGAAGGLAACATGAAGRRVAPLAEAGAGPGGRGSAGAPGGTGGTGGRGGREGTADPGPYAPAAPHRPPNPDTNPYLRVPEELRGPGAGAATGGGPGAAADGSPAAGETGPGAGPATGEGRGAGAGAGPSAGETEAGQDRGTDAADVYGAPTVARPFVPPRRGRGARAWPTPPPPPDEAPPPPGEPRSPRGG